MARKEEYTAEGHDVTIQSVNGNEPSAWIDGYAGYTSHIFDNSLDALPDDIQGKIEVDLQEGDVWPATKTLLVWMISVDVYYCKKCETFYDYDNVVGTGFAGHKCAKCDQGDKYCADNPDGDSHEDECLNPRDKRNARVSTKYRCKHCGRKRQTVPTG